MSIDNSKKAQQCPCGTGIGYPDCCGIFISGQKTPSTPEELMRSRYTAYNLANIDYIARTMKSPAADNFDTEDASTWAKAVNWIGLEVINTTCDSKKGMVEFKAHYYFNGKKNVLHEISEFMFIDGKWYYANGTQPNSIIKIGRNDNCSCGSNKKYKKCCGK